MKNFVILIIFCLVPVVASAKHLHQEKHYQGIWCAENKGVVEQVFSDGTRCDCITATHAVEVDFAGKWAESLGQALHYSLMTGKSAGILLIIEKEKEWKYYFRLKHIIDSFKLPVTIWTIQPNQIDSGGTNG